ncbi:unnamed protein product, partial [Symbiodinium natans]
MEPCWHALRAGARQKAPSFKSQSCRLLGFLAGVLATSLAGQLAFVPSLPVVRYRIRRTSTQRCSLEPGTEGSCTTFVGLWPVRPEDEAMADAEMQLHFERSGFCHAQELLTVDEASALAQELAKVQSSEICEMAALQHELRQHVDEAVARSCRTAQDCRRMLQKFEKSGKVKFLQYFNLHRHSPFLRRAALSPRLGLWAARLLGVPQVRLYQDALFMKYPRHGPTRWHSDLALSPFDTNAFVTVWLALTPVKAKGGAGLRFARGSHRDYTLQYHTELADRYTQDDLSSRYPIEECTELQPGDATWHHGWTLHAASRSPRVAWAISFVASDARILPEESLNIVQAAEDSVSQGLGRCPSSPGFSTYAPVLAMNWFVSGKGDVNKRMGALAKLSNYSAQSERAVQTLFNALDGAMRRHEHALVWAVLNSLGMLVSSPSCCQLLLSSGYILLLHRVLEIYTALPGILPNSLARRDEKLRSATKKEPEFVSTFKPSAIEKNSETVKQWWLKKSTSLPDIVEIGPVPRRPPSETSGCSARPLPAAAGQGSGNRHWPHSTGSARGAWCQMSTATGRLSPPVTGVPSGGWRWRSCLRWFANAPSRISSISALPSARAPQVGSGRRRCTCCRSCRIEGWPPTRSSSTPRSAPAKRAADGRWLWHCSPQCPKCVSLRMRSASTRVSVPAKRLVSGASRCSFW